MSIWKNGELVPHSYEKTIVASTSNSGLLIWLEGTNTKLSFHKEHRGNKHYIVNSEFGICGGAINTNDGIRLTKEHLLEIASKMKEGATLNIAAGKMYITKRDLLYSNQETTVEENFDKDNDMVQIGPNSFAPSNHAKTLKK